MFNYSLRLLLLLLVLFITKIFWYLTIEHPKMIENACRVSASVYKLYMLVHKPTNTDINGHYTIVKTAFIITCFCRNCNQELKRVPKSNLSQWDHFYFLTETWFEGIPNLSPYQTKRSVNTPQVCEFHVS